MPETATLFIDGQWVAASNGATRTIICPADGSEVGVVSEGTSDDANRAVEAARAAFDKGEWRNTPASERGDFLIRVAEEIERRKADFAKAEALDTGKRLVEAEGDMDDIAGCFRYFGKIADSNPGRLVDAGDDSCLLYTSPSPRD